MDKNSLIAIIVIVGVILVGAIGYAFWSNSQPAQVTQTTQQTTQTTTTTTNPATQPAAPSVQTNSTTAPYISTVVVKGTVNPNGALTTYWYEYGLTSALGTKTGNYLVGSGYTNLYAPAYITGLQSNTNYYYRLNANNSFGTVNGAVYTFKTNTTPVPTGTAPTTSTQSASDVARTTVNLHGNINPNGSETTFWFEYGLSSNLGNVTAFQTANTSNSASAVSVSLSNLQPLTKYFFRLNAQNQFGTINGEILNFTTKGPVTATAPTVKTGSVSAITTSSAKLNASVNPNGAATTYWFEYSNSALLSTILFSSTEQQLADGASLVNVSADTGTLTSNTKYYFRIVAKNQYGTVKGDAVAFTTKR